MMENDKYLLNMTIADPDKKLGWGIYNIKRNLIKIQFWASPSGGGYAAPILGGEILYNEAFTLKYSDSIDTFYFRKFSPKPDSTNQFIN